MEGKWSIVQAGKGGAKTIFLIFMPEGFRKVQELTDLPTESLKGFTESRGHTHSYIHARLHHCIHLHPRYIDIP